MPIEIGRPEQRALVLASPVLPAAGFLGYGRAYPGILDPHRFGALVTAPTALSATGREEATFARLGGAFIMPGRPRAGLSAVLREYAPGWTRWRVPVVLAVAVRDAADAAAMAARLEHEDSVSGLELPVPAGAGSVWLREVLRAFGAHCDLPVMAKLPLLEAAELAPVAVAAGAAAIVLGTPYTAADPASDMAGPLYGPATLGYTLQAVRALSPGVGLPVVASGGVYSAADAAACLRSGAVAVQLDGIMLLDPLGAAGIARTLDPRPLPSHR